MAPVFHTFLTSSSPKLLIFLNSRILPLNKKCHTRKDSRNFFAPEKFRPTRREIRPTRNVFDHTRTNLSQEIESRPTRKDIRPTRKSIRSMRKKALIHIISDLTHKKKVDPRWQKPTKIRAP